jgi:hypothetical protein
MLQTRVRSRDWPVRFVLSPPQFALSPLQLNLTSTPLRQPGQGLPSVRSRATRGVRVSLQVLVSSAFADFAHVSLLSPCAGGLSACMFQVPVPALVVRDIGPMSSRGSGSRETSGWAMAGELAFRSSSFDLLYQIIMTFNLSSRQHDMPPCSTDTSEVWRGIGSRNVTTITRYR